MLRTICKSKITNLFVTGTELRYSGSLGMDKKIAEAADIMPGEQVHVLNVNNGERMITYVIEEKEGSGRVVLYGPAARRGEVGDELVVLSYCFLETKETHNFKKKTIELAKNNQYKPNK